MNKSKLTPYLGLCFIVAVVLPSIILAVIAFRSISREQAYMEKQMQNSLQTEVSYVASLIDAHLKKIEEQLNDSIIISNSQSIADQLSRWSSSFELVEMPFYLSPTQDILWPDYQQSLTNSQRSFLNWNKQFLADEIRIPVFENVAVAYKEEILKEVDISKNIEVAAQLVDEDISEGKGGSSFSSTSLAKADEPTDKGKSYYDSEYRSQQAISQFRQYAPVREKVYEQAQATGKKVLKRTVQVSDQVGSPELKNKLANELQEVNNEPESIFVEQPLKFSQIVSQGSWGIIPRFIEDELKFIFWKRLSSNYIVGCMINTKALQEEIISVLPDIYTSARVLTVLNEKGSPLITPVESLQRNWRRPFAAGEISEKLPRWEVASYLSDPNSISSKARLREFIMFILVAILFISIVGGGVLVLRSLHSEITLTQQKTTFVANVSHELKTPLTSIRMFAEILKDKRQPDQGKKSKYLNIMVSEAERLTRLINNVLDFSRTTESKKRYAMRKIDIVSLCREIMEIQRVRLEQKGFEISFDSDIEALSVEADEEAIKQAIINLLFNAEKYSTDTKKIGIDIKQEEESVLINIKDRGVGIDLKHAKHIFEEFYRVDDSLTSEVRGTGLGLTIAKRIIKDHAGQIKYILRSGGGSVFQIKLPIKES